MEGNRDLQESLTGCLVGLKPVCDHVNVQISLCVQQESTSEQYVSTCPRLMDINVLIAFLTKRISVASEDYNS